METADPLDSFGSSFANEPGHAENRVLNRVGVKNIS